MLTSIRLQNFKTHRDTEIHLGRLTVLVGPNGAGKSSVLQAIGRAPFITHGAKFDDYKTLARNGELVGACVVSLGGFHDDSVPWTLPSDVPRTTESNRDLRAELRSALLLPNPTRMAEAVPITATAPALASDGAGLADVVAAMRDADDAGFQALQSALRGVVPQIDRIGIKRTKLPKELIAHELTFDVSGRKGIPASQMSGGTLLALAILALLHSPQRPRILLLDDIDHGLHPKAQWDLLKQLRRLLAQYPDLQIVATSHSPDLVDELDPSEVVVMALRADGTSAAKPLTACPREDMLGVLRAGQLWSAVGEDWVTADPPATQTAPADPTEPQP